MERVQPRKAGFKFQPKLLRALARLGDEFRRVRLSQVYDAAVVFEVDGPKFRVTIQPQAADHDRIELPDHEVRQEEGSEFRFVDFLKTFGAREELVTVGSRKSLDAVLVEHSVQAATGSAIRIRNEDLVVAVLDLLQFRSPRIPPSATADNCLDRIYHKMTPRGQEQKRKKKNGKTGTDLFSQNGGERGKRAMCGREP